MRVMLKVNIPVEEGNRLIREGKLSETIEAILAEQKPEAAYFCDDNGMRTAFIVVQIRDNSQVPSLVEPWFLAFNAHVEIHLVMVSEDLEKAAGAFKKASKEFALT